MKNSNTKGKNLKTIKKCRPILLIVCLFGITNTLYLGFTFPINLGTSDGENDYIIEQITDNDFDDGYHPDYGTWGLPQIHNGQVIWSGGPDDGEPFPSMHEWEIFLHDSNIGITTQITDDDTYLNVNPQIHGGLGTWMASDGNDYEIFLYDSNTGVTTQITDNNVADDRPLVHEGLVVWQNYGNLFLYDHATGVTTQITDDENFDLLTSIHNGLITWEKWDGTYPDDNVFVYDYNTGVTTQITDDDYGHYGISVHDGLIVWYTAGNLFLYDYNTGVTSQITDDKASDRFPRIHNGLITWMKSHGSSHGRTLWHLYLYNYATGITTQLTDDDRSVYSPQIHDGLITFMKYDNDWHDTEIFLYDSNTGITTQMTNNNYGDGDPQIHNGMITWIGFEEHDSEIFLAIPLADKTPPIIEIEYENGDRNDGNPGKWNVEAYDDESEINEDTIKVLIDGEFAGNTLGDYDVPNTLGEHTIYVEVENNDGYLGSESDSVTIIDDDTTYPVLNYFYTGDGTDGNPGEIIVTASDDSGLSVDPSGTYSVPNSLGTPVFVFTATDNDNDRVDDALTRTVEISINIIDDDVTAPLIDIEYNGSGFDDDPGYFEWNVYDIDSGINHINITVTYESTEGLDDYTLYLEGTEMGSWELSPNLGIYTIRIFARDNDDDRGLFVDSLTVEVTTDQEILDDDVDPPELSNLVIIPDIFEINVTMVAIDESGIGDISTFINGDLIEPITQIQYGNTYSFIFENQWLFQSGASEVVVQVEDGDDDRPNDALASSITGTFENILYPTYEYIIWQIEELKNYIDENLCHRVARSLNRKLSKAQDHLYEAINYFEDGSISCALFHDCLAKLFIRLDELRTEIFNRKELIADDHAEYIIESLHEIRNNIVLLMGASTGEEKAYKIALIEVELLNLKDFIEDEIPCCVGRCLSAKISVSAKLLELALFEISMGNSIDWILEYTQCKLEHTITKINFLLEKGKIPEDVANYLIEKISSIIGDIEQIKNI